MPEAAKAHAAGGRPAEPTSPAKPPVVKLDISHSSNEANFRDVKFRLDLTVAGLKKFLVRYVGTEPQFMQISLQDENGGLKAVLDDDEALLSDFQPLDTDGLYVAEMPPNAHDTNGIPTREPEPAAEDVVGELEAEKGSPSPTRSPGKVPRPSLQITDDEHMKDLAAAIRVDQPCVVSDHTGSKPGVVKYVGKIPQLAPGWWVGVAYAELVGRYDGSVKGKRYFRCEPNGGGFLRPDTVQQTAPAPDEEAAEAAPATPATPATAPAEPAAAAGESG